MDKETAQKKVFTQFVVAVVKVEKGGREVELLKSIFYVLSFDLLFLFTQAARNYKMARWVASLFNRGGVPFFKLAFEFIGLDV